MPRSFAHGDNDEGDGGLATGRPPAPTAALINQKIRKL